MPDIHPTAVVADEVELHDSVVIGPHCVIDAGAVIGAGCVLESAVRVGGTVRLGQRNRVGHGAAIGGWPQDTKFTEEKSRPLTIGDDNTFREGVTVNRGTYHEQGTVIGSANYFMVNAHVGHDCVVGDHNIFANGACLGGHVVLEDRVFLSSFVAVHQFCRVGSYVMAGGLTAITTDVPPYVMVNGQRAQIVGLNTVGLRRGGFDAEQRLAIKRAYQVLYRSALPRAGALGKLREEHAGPEVDAILAFIEAGTRALVGHV
ncbi:MAG: acyl-ACP--UDP-N-acetylglucosamine O-acyltransferase [Gammaproteobacteria bacterium]|nr:acyl-ACP--UDP-N-acetylglucosamine O-acyltransferase [Gammaproteobacteria bacterium]